MTNSILTEQHRTHDRLSALADVYEGMDRILTGGRIKVQIAEEKTVSAPAWSTGDEIFFNRSRVTGTDVENISRLHGLNVHELAHVLYTPRKGTTFTATILEERLSATSNLLEDQRIETLLTSVYPSTRLWLQAAVGRWIVNSSESDLSRAYTLVRGRKYLPGALRGSLRSVWAFPEVLPDIDRIIDRYRLLTYPADYDEGLDLTRQLHAILESLNIDPGYSIPDPFGHGTRPVEVLTKGRPRPAGDQRRARDRADDGEPEEDVRGAGDKDDNEEEDPGFDVAAAGTGEDSDSGQGSDGDHSSGAGAGSDDFDDVRDLADELVQQVMSNSEVRKEIQRTQRQVAGRGAGDELGESKKVTIRDPAPEFRSLSKQFRKVLERLVRQADPGWLSRESSGKVNALRWAQEGDATSAFDRWDDGIHDAVDLEVVILLDESGSMQDRIHTAVDSMWATKRALDGIDASTTVLCFSSESRTLYKSSEKAEGKAKFVYDGGGTDPIDALRQAAEIFQYTHRSQKILLIFTDGQWFGSTDDHHLSSEDYIERMNRAGVVTALGYITDGNEYVRDVDSHGCKVSAVVDCRSLVSFVQQIVTASIRQRLSRR